MGFDYEAATAWGALLAAIVAAAAVIVESRRSRFALGLETLMNLRAQFHSDAMLRARAKAARSIADNSYADTLEVLNFFEMIGFLTRRGALDPGMVWHGFFYWIDGYCVAADSDIESRSQKDPTFLSDLKSIHAILLRIERRERVRIGVTGRRAANTEEFLQEERLLDGASKT